MTCASQTAAGEKLVELVLQHAASLPAVGLFNFTATAESEIAAWVAINDQFPINFILTGLVTWLALCVVPALLSEC